jgi:methyl-accepting chemotaxis protein
LISKERRTMSTKTKTRAKPAKAPTKTASAPLKAPPAAARELAELRARIEATARLRAMFRIDLEGTILSANENFLKPLGYTEAEVVGGRFERLLKNGYAATPAYTQIWEQLRRGESAAVELQLPARDGRELWFQTNLNAALLPDGRPFEVICYATDITQQKQRSADFEGQLAAIGKAQAVIEFTLDGHILGANDNFLHALGYSLDEIKGQHHRMFVDPAQRESVEYRLFWEKLGRGEYDTGQYRRLGKGGKEIWIQASYNPILDTSGKPFKVVKYATDITQQKLRSADFEGQLAAISKAQAVIEFSLDGRILNANDNFLQVLGYSLDEIKGQHHRMFVDPAQRDSVEYRLFWEKLGRGEYDSGQYRRLGKGGKEIWIQASYNPIFDMNGKPFKVVKYASDISAQVQASRALQSAVEETQDVVSAAKDGDLTRRIVLDGKSGSIKDLCAGVNSLVENLAAVVGQIKESSGAINTAAREIASGNADLSARTEQQAASLEETASSMEELTSTVKQNAENARQANQLAIGAADVASRGGSVVSEVVTTMSAIHDSSKKIVDIISVIDGIAFQTNILALNAAVEAARAGEQGRGFAVVAAEVRSLAQRSAGAAKEIKTLINDSVEKVGNGTKLVEQAGKTMQEIVTSVKRVTDIMGEITAASQEQSSGIEQVNQAITQMDETTQQNAALVEEVSASARSLEEQSTAQVAAVRGFVLDGEDATARERPAAAKPAAERPAPAAPAARMVRPAKPAPAATTRPKVNGSHAPQVNGGHAPREGGDAWTEF